MNTKLNLLRRFFNNKYSRSDYMEIKRLLDQQDSELEYLMQLHWKEFSRENLSDQKDLSHLFGAIEKRTKFARNISLARKLWSTYSKVAAVVAIPLLVALSILYVQFHGYLSQKDVFVNVVSPAGSRTSLNLPDGSTVWLNGESSIRYPAIFNGNRHVSISGEAFFKVHSDKEHPFLVAANGVTVRATGTEFDVAAYADENEIRVVLKEGKVTVRDEMQSMLKKMQAGYLLSYDKKTETLNYNTINATNYSGWINGKLIFENVSLKEVVNRMEHWYGVDIEIVDKELMQLHFKATFMDENVDQALKLLQSTSAFHYHYAKRNVRADGSYEHTKIFITK
ncbi:MAG TPA: FecR domain-containing protein [Sunxiuqinia sp.]|nr:FecR domain-containing protein [Sunxiuqinia sp.]